MNVFTDSFKISPQDSFGNVVQKCSNSTIDLPKNLLRKSSLDCHRNFSNNFLKKSFGNCFSISNSKDFFRRRSYDFFSEIPRMECFSKIPQEFDQKFYQKGSKEVFRGLLLKTRQIPQAFNWENFHGFHNNFLQGVVQNFFKSFLRHLEVPSGIVRGTLLEIV